MTKKKEDFESPLSRFIRLNCSLCKDWTNQCNMSERGMRRMKLCMFAAKLQKGCGGHGKNPDESRS